MEPCTEAEVKMLAHDWVGYFKDHYKGDSGVILLRNMRVMEDSGSIYTDFGVASESACTNESEYKGIFCRGLQPNCDEAVSLNKQDVSDYQCAHWCHDAHSNCKETQPSNSSPCFYEVQKTHPILQQCTVPLELEDKEQRDSNMVAGTVVITTEWKLVKFETAVSPNPVVFTGILNPLGTFAQVQVTGVSETGFHIRLALDHCRIGYAPAYAQVSWIAISEDSFSIPGSSISIRVATVEATVGESIDVLPGFKLHSSSPVVLTQIQDIPVNLPMTDIPYIRTIKVAASSTTIIVENTTALTKLAKIKGGWYNTVHYSEDHFGSRPPLIFGSVVVKDGDKTTLLVQRPIQSTSAKAIWNPRLYVISRDSCRDFVFEEVSVFFGTTLLMVLHVKDHFIPNCAGAKSKVGSATDADCVAECTALSDKCTPPLTWDCFVASASEELKAKCYVEPSVDTAQTTTTTTPPPIGASVHCRIVDMSSYLDIGWDVEAMSCSCPQGFSPCTQHQVEQDRAHWIQDISPWGMLCRTWDAVQPVARGFMQVASDLCTASSSIRWQQRELPLYSLDDVFLNGRINTSGYNQCVVDTPLVFCPSASLTTTTSTTAPTWDWPENADCLPGDWSECSLCRHSDWTEWSSCSEKLLDFGFSPVTTSYREKLVFAEAGGACSELNLREYDDSRCTGEGDNNAKTSIPASALQISSDIDAVADSEKWSEWSSCDAPCLLNGQKARRYKLSIKQDSTVEDVPLYHSCDDILPVHDIEEDREFCKEQCKRIIDSCLKESKLEGKTPLQCFAEYVTENQPVGGKCIYTQKLVKETTTPTCFPSFSRMNDDESSEFRFLDPKSPSMQCLCLTPDSIPCTATEVFESRQTTFAMTSSCPRQDADGATFDEGTPGTADSKLFFAAADSAKIFCPLSDSKNLKQQEYAATYSIFKSADEMNEYCANGLEAQHELSASTPYDITLDCTKLVPRTDSVSADECKEKCVKVKEACADSTVDYLSCIATKREVTGFNAECATKGTVFAGRGIVFCKLVPKDCAYSEWGEWSACSASCRSGVGGVEASYKTCRCPSYTRPCTLAEAEASRSLWNQNMMALCQEDSVAVIPLIDFGLFDCETRTFKESVVDFNDLTAEDQCSTDQFSSVFCVVAEDIETERRHMLITMLIMLFGGTIVGIAFVLWFIQHSVDVQKVLGLRGRYVELVNMVKE
ncbi:hypothetical protein EMWEY_00008720 [Eimeria maxima]|uniref:Thrombospondin type 1 domain-containing protein n=1 Tax=Eimeria maxima TaxID=5804 RepID=U6MF35_EIMMA|nr:hypothetical protein EMWEY_00008720 [Eimeria maxima]CDJ61049.1 hypothetical protein EMWEY_00008720 [Eimeria maxima]